MKLAYPLYIAADHGGYQLKKRLVRYLKNELKIKIQDLGPKKYDAEDDFPDYIIPTAKKAVKTKGKAIMICGSGIGACISANKVKGMRAALAYNLKAAEMSRLHNNANGLCLAGRVLTEEHAMSIVKKWLETEEFLGGKYERRNRKIKNFENKK
jgi:ribose 5-phosphate isomerase B